jgi:hypothetical protein
LYGTKAIKTIKSGEDTIELDAVKSRTQTVAAACQGLCQALQNAVAEKVIDGFALSEAKCLTKPAMGAPLLAAKVKYIVENSINEIAEASSSKTAVELAFSGVMEKIEASTKTETSTAIVPAKK